MEKGRGKAENSNYHKQCRGSKSVISKWKAIRVTNTKDLISKIIPSIIHNNSQSGSFPSSRLHNLVNNGQNYNGEQIRVECRSRPCVDNFD